MARRRPTGKVRQWLRRLEFADASISSQQGSKSRRQTNEAAPGGFRYGVVSFGIGCSAALIWVCLAAHLIPSKGWRPSPD
jgi:hypothetical protein